MLDHVRSLYTNDEYFNKNPTLHEKDSSWKVSKILPLVDKAFISGDIKRQTINLLDVGGGAGIILRDVSSYIENRYGVHVNKYALDLSPKILEIQKKNNPDLLKALNEDICETSLTKDEIDITLMIDVLEHIPNPERALEELKRVSRIVIFKVPLELNFISCMWNFINRGKPRKHEMETIGHINFYTFNSLKYQIEKHCGRVIDSYFNDGFDYFLNSNHYRGTKSKKFLAIQYIASHIFDVSPRLSSYWFTDSIMILTRCDPTR